MSLIFRTAFAECPVFEIQPDGSIVKVDDPPKPADMVVVIRCRDCKHYHSMINGCDWFVNEWYDEYVEVEPDGYCAWGERRDA